MTKTIVECAMQVAISEGKGRNGRQVRKGGGESSRRNKAKETKEKEMHGEKRAMEKK